MALGVEVRATEVTVGTTTELVTGVADTARLPLPAASSTAPASSATVRFVIMGFRATVRSSSTLVPVALAALVVRGSVPDMMVTRVRSAAPMSSLKVRITFVPSREVVGASVPVVTRVGRMPSTLCAGSIRTAAWSRLALRVVLPVAVMVPPVSLFAAIAMPSGAESPAATLYTHTIVVVFMASAQPAAFGSPAKSSSSCGAPVMSTAALKVTVASTSWPMA